MIHDIIPRRLWPLTAAHLLFAPVRDLDRNPANEVKHAADPR